MYWEEYMSECVVRMEMPTRCDLCDFWCVCKNVADFGKARYFEEPRELTVGMKGCKIVCQLPEGHGRLVDADANFLGVIHLSSGGFANCNTTIAERLGEEDMRTVKVIVPAERSET
jgi:hypothetical protein